MEYEVLIVIFVCCTDAFEDVGSNVVIDEEDTVEGVAVGCVAVVLIGLNCVLVGEMLG